MPPRVIDISSDSDSDVEIVTRKPTHASSTTPTRTHTPARRPIAPDSDSDDELTKPSGPQYLRGSRINSFSAHAAVVQVWSPRKRDGRDGYESQGRQQLRAAKSQPATPTKVRRLLIRLPDTAS